MKKERSSFEIAVVVIVVVATVMLGVGLYSARAKVEKSRLLMHELGMFRSALTLYRIMNHANPPTLEGLATSDFDSGGVRRPYLDRLPPTEDGSLVDPFGNKYIYNGQTGWVSSATKGYENW